MLPVADDYYIQGTQDDPTDLKEIDSAGFIAGVLYSATKQFVDRRDYIAECFHQDFTLDQSLLDAFDSYIQGDYVSATQTMLALKNVWSDSMADCQETHTYFEQIDSIIDDFFAQKDWKTAAQINYEANKDVVDDQWGSCLKTWNEGIYFDSGVYFTRVARILSGRSLVAF